jgi:hypothetical protein
MDRRSFLSLLGAVAVPAIAGCSRDQNAAGDQTTTATTGI